MNKKFLITSAAITFGLVATAIPTSINFLKAKGAQVPQELSSEITAAKPGKGETVSYLPDALAEFWQMEDLVNTYPDNAARIGELAPYSPELTTWTLHMSQLPEDLAYRRNMFKKYDLFRPTNNILAWNSTVSAKGYKVIVSQEKDFAHIEKEYNVNGNETSVIFDNPYTGTNYYWQVIATKNDDSKVYSDIFNFSSAALPRTINLEGVSNTRDLGGNVGKNGKRTKEGLIYRGMGLEAITNSGQSEFNKLGIKTEIDLRGIGEGIENYLGLPNYYHYSSPYDYVGGLALTQGIDYFGEGSLVTNFGNALKVLANKNNYPVYFHCAVGRDRTGWMGLAINFLCGVSEEAALKDFILSLFSTSGAYTKGNLDFYTRYIRIRDYINTYPGNNLSEKMENYLVTRAGMTSEECNNIRKIFLGEIDTGFVPGSINPNPLTDLAKVTFRKHGEASIIKLVEKGSTVEKPSISGEGKWYHGDVEWNFDVDVVTEDIYLDYLTNDTCRVNVHYNGINLPDNTIEVAYNTYLDYSVFEKEGYTFKVYDDNYNLLESCLVLDHMSINVVYKSLSGFIPKGNSRIIVMAGQSNAAGVGHYEYLEKSLDSAKIAEINNGYSNVLMAGYSHGDYMNTFRKVYADKSYASATAPGTFGFEVGLADRLSKAFPDETTYIVKYAHGGTSLNYDWVSPSSYDVEVCVPYDPSNERGWLYTGLVNSLTNAIESISETTNTIPMVEAFMWMQGENDASEELANSLYLSTFNNLIDDFMGTFHDNISSKFTVYDAGIAEGTIWPYAKQMNATKRSRVNDWNVYIETNDRLTTLYEPIGAKIDEAHYDAGCYIDLGHMFADAYLSKTVRGYTHDALEIGEVEPIEIAIGETTPIIEPVVYFNGIAVKATMSYFARQHTGFTVYHHFVVNNDNTITATKIGSSSLKITAYFNNEVRTIIVPVEVIA